MNRMSFLLVTLLAASFAVTTRPTGTSPAEQGSPTGAARTPTTKPQHAGMQPLDIEGEAHTFLSTFLYKEKAFDSNGDSREKPAFKVLFATLADPVETHLAATFDHDLAALQDGVQDSGYLFDSSLIPWDFPRDYDDLGDELVSHQLSDQKHDYPGILVFRKGNQVSDSHPYREGLIVFLLTEKPTAGVNIAQADTALKLLKWIQSQKQSSPGSSQFEFANNTALIAGPGFSGSLDSFVDLAYSLEHADGIKPPTQLLVRSSGFTNCLAGVRIAGIIHDRFNLKVDLGSAADSFEPLAQLALDTLNTNGIPQDRVAILSEGESLFGQSVEPGQTTPNQGCPPLSSRAWNLEYPRDISALRSTYEKQGLLNKPAPPEVGRQSLRIEAEDKEDQDSVRSYGGAETVAAQESVLFGISSFLQLHAIRAVIVLATSEQDSYFLTQFLHANNAGVRVVIFGTSREFMRGSTAQFRGDMMVDSFPLLPKLYDWTASDPAPSPGQSEHQDTVNTFSNDTSQGEYVAVRDLLWNPEAKPSPPREYSLPNWSGEPSPLRPPAYVVALGGGTAWPVSEGEEKWDVESDSSTGQPKPAQQPSGTSGGKSSQRKENTTPTSGWRVSMPFIFARHFDGAGPDGSRSQTPINVASFWEFLLYLCAAVPLFYCFGVLYADPLQHRAFAYLRPADSSSDWIYLVAVPALLSQFSFLLLAQQISFPTDIPGNHQCWWITTVTASALLPLLIIGVNWRMGCKARCFASGSANCDAVKSKIVFALTTLVVLAVMVAWFAAGPANDLNVSQILGRYREMHWESGLSLLPTTMLMVLAMSVWNYGTLIGISVLRSRLPLPTFDDDQRISATAGEAIAAAGQPLPRGGAAKRFWIATAVAALATLFTLMLWQPFRSITSLSSRNETIFIFVLTAVPSILMLIDIVQFAWVWSLLRELLHTLDGKTFKRSFVPLREFNWKNIWKFSNGSLQEMRKIVSAQIDCALEISRNVPHEFEPEVHDFKRLRMRYSKYDLSPIGLESYREDMRVIYAHFRTIGSDIANRYADMLLAVPPAPCAQTGPVNNDPFRDEEEELRNLPGWLCLYERFLCLLYIGFIQAIIARLRSLAIAIVSEFSLIALGVAIYPFQPMQPLFIVGAAIFVAIGVIMYAVFSQMDKDRILARILQSDPNKLEWSFYSKYIDALALPLLTLLSSLLPGGAGRIIDLVRNIFSHAQ
jgi:hypothetical protein